MARGIKKINLSRLNQLESQARKSRPSIEKDISQVSSTFTITKISRRSNQIGSRARSRRESIEIKTHPKYVHIREVQWNIDKGIFFRREIMTVLKNEIKGKV